MIFHDKHMKFNLNWKMRRLIFNKKISPEADFFKVKMAYRPASYSVFESSFSTSAILSGLIL
jgi:hypothetical protein